MARSQNSFIKKEREKKKQQKKKEKLQRKEERKSNASSGELDDMIAYIDEDGNIVDTPPDTTIKKKEIKAEDLEVSVPKSAPVEKTKSSGTVAFFDDSKGYGFINQEGSGDRLFVHSSNTSEDIFEGDKVEFFIEKGPRGLVAVEVDKLS